LDETSQAIDAARSNAVGIAVRDPDVYLLPEQVHRRVLRAGTSCNFFWRDAWLQRCQDDLDQPPTSWDQAVARLT
jgi:hypothetical protein